MKPIEEMLQSATRRCGLREEYDYDFMEQNNINPFQDSRYTLEMRRYEAIAAAGPEVYHGLENTSPIYRAGIIRGILAAWEVKQFVNLGPGFGSLERVCYKDFNIVDLDSCVGFLARIKEEMPEVCCVRGIAEELPFCDEAVECFISESTFQSIVDRVRFLYELGRVVEPGGHIILSVAYAWHYPRKPQDGFNVLRDDERRTLTLFLEELGFDVDYTVANVEQKKWNVTMEEGDYLYIIGRKNG